MVNPRFLPESLRAPAVAVLVGWGLLSLAAGCGRVDEIKHYTVTKPAVLEQEYFGEARRPPESKTLDGMWGAIVPHGERIWFFKLVGPNKAVAAEAEPFAHFIESLKFGDGADSPPEWKLPEGWHQKPGSGMRYATITVDVGDEKLDMSVIPLGREGPEETAILLNVNRWRGQLDLKPITVDQLPEQTKSITLSFGRALIVGMVGHLKSGGMGGPMSGSAATGPFSGGAAPLTGGELPPDHPALPADHPPLTTGPAAPVAGSPGLTFDTPAGWQPAPLGPMRKASFVVRDGDQKAEISVIALPPFAGNLLDNVNRWRGQLDLSKITAEEVAKQVKPMTVGDATGSYVQLTAPAEPAPRQAMLAVLAARADQVWSVKLMGDAALVERERPHFEAFVKSIKFAAP